MAEVDLQKASQLVSNRQSAAQKYDGCRTLIAEQILQDPGNYDTGASAWLLGELCRPIGGEKAMLLWDSPGCSSRRFSNLCVQLRSRYLQLGLRLGNLSSYSAPWWHDLPFWQVTDSGAQ